jgi:TetR/AcrR family transcriptional regulator
MEFPRRPVGSAHKHEIRKNNETRILEAAEEVFAEAGFKGATTALIARRAGIPKANLHYYFSTKEILYRHVLDDILRTWLEAADLGADWENPMEALRHYIEAKMDLSRTRPNGSKIWAAEIMHGAPMIQDYLSTTLNDWLRPRVEIIQCWIDAGLICAVNPKNLIYSIWALTQHYADFSEQIQVLNDCQPLSDEQFAQAKKDVVQIILNGVMPHST